MVASCAAFPLLCRPDQVFWLWTRRSDPVWYQKRSLHRQRIPRGEQVAGHAWWVHQKICAVCRVWQPWNWSGKYFTASPGQVQSIYLFCFFVGGRQKGKEQSNNLIQLYDLMMIMCPLLLAIMTRNFFHLFPLCLQRLVTMKITWLINKY